MSISIISETLQDGFRTVVFDVADAAGTERFTAQLLRKGIHPRSGNFTVWVNVSHASMPIYAGEDFQFPRAATSGQRIVTDGNGNPLMDNDQPAPTHTTQTATQLVLEQRADLRVLNALAQVANNATVNAELATLRSQLIVPFVGQHYLPEGRTWKREDVATLTASNVLEAVAGASLRKYRRLQTAGVFDESIDPIGGGE